MTPLEAEILAYNPWLAEVGLTGLLVQLIESGASDDEIVSKIRGSAEYKAAFPGIKDSAGKMRFTSEAEYLATVRDYKDVLAEFGAPASSSDDPLDFLGFIEGSVDPQELKDRFTIYRQLEVSGKEVIDAFYVYTGMKITTDDLYEAVISPQYAQQLTSAYDNAAATQDLTWPTYVERVTEIGIQGAMAGGASPGSIDTVAAQELVAAVANPANQPTSEQGGTQITTSVAGVGGQGANPAGPEAPTYTPFRETTSQTGNTNLISLQELIASLEYALIGGAALTQGLKLPSLEKIQEIRLAGVDRARAMQQYGLYAKMGEGFSGMVQRANLGTGLDQSTFEDAALLGKVTAQSLFEQSIAQEQNLGRAAGTFSTSLDNGRIVQQGRS